MAGTSAVEVAGKFYFILEFQSYSYVGIYWYYFPERPVFSIYRNAFWKYYLWSFHIFKYTNQYNYFSLARRYDTSY